MCIGKLLYTVIYVVLEPAGNNPDFISKTKDTGVPLALDKMIITIILIIDMTQSLELVIF